MKKIMSLILVGLLFISTLWGCSKENVNTAPVGESLGLSLSADTPKEDIIAHNKSIPPEQINLIQFEPPKTGDTYAVIRTTLGDIYFILYPDQAPNAVENFSLHAKNGFYNNTDFHTVMQNFYLESGAPPDKPKMSAFIDESGNPIGFPNELSLDLWHFRGALATRNKGPKHPDTNTSEFYIVQNQYILEDWFEAMEENGYPAKILEKYKEVGGIPGYDTHDTVFGQVYEGMDVVDKIANTPVNRLFVPEEPVIITNILIGTYDEENPVHLEPLPESAIQEAKDTTTLEYDGKNKEGENSTDPFATS